jgi:predicted MPP superfamily phosphohydrolase
VAHTAAAPLPSLFLPPSEAAVPARLIWAANRFWMETENRKTGRYGGKGRHHWYVLLFLMRSLRLALKLTGQYERGVRNVAPMEAMGIRVLVNEGVTLARGDARLQVIGTDDVHYYFTDQAVHALEKARDAFTVALVHSPEAYDVAAQLGVDLYLTGHTHAGQVCLPGGWPLITHVSRGRRLFRGIWHQGDMLGVTNAGSGTSGIPVRFNTRGEVLVLTLRRLA